MRVNLSRLPDPPREYVLDFPRLDGGLNTEELDYRLKADESPDMVNLWWKDGVLCSRWGQVYLTEEELGTGYSAWEQPFHGWTVFHAGDRLYALDESGARQELCAAVPENRGTWFRFGEGLYYKNRGGYFRILPDGEGGLTCGAVEGYVPVVQINSEPTTGAGDLYQPENRLSGRKTVWYSTVEGVKEYHLPETGIEGVEQVEVDGVTLTEGFTVDAEAGTVTFESEPTHHDPVRVNTVKITYAKGDAEAEEAVMDCPYAAVYGGSRDVCVVVGGCPAQPNAYFWSGSHLVMDPAYFPVEQYNLAGEAGDGITGFGEQQSMLVIFKEHSLGRAVMGTAEMGSGRTLLTLDYTPINGSIGCDLPWTIRLVENNLVFACAGRGVHLIRDSSAAGENNVVRLSRKVNRDLLPALGRGVRVTSWDDGSRYWLAADGAVYLWDYSISGYGDPVWFYFTGIGAAAFFERDGELCHLDGAGRVTALRNCFHDHGGPILKRYRFAVQHMGSYQRRKDVTGVLLTVRGDTDTTVDVTYETDWERRREVTPIRSWTWRLAPRNLAYRCLEVGRFATVARRRPACRGVRHFTMELENNVAGMDLTVISAQILYRFQGRER